MPGDDFHVSPLLLDCAAKNTFPLLCSVQRSLSLGNVPWFAKPGPLSFVLAVHPVAFSAAVSTKKLRRCVTEARPAAGASAL